jgi:glutathione S-transferase
LRARLNNNEDKENHPMQLIGMLDSPYVRRVAISLQLLELPFEHRSISVFRGFAQIQAINPAVKVPTLVCDDGGVLMDSTLILDHAESLAAQKGGRSLMPRDIKARQQALWVIGLALAACEKSVQRHYEHVLRPSEKLHAPWVDRVTGQMVAACAALEDILAAKPLHATTETIDQAGVSVAVAWHFIQRMMPEVVDASKFPRLQDFSLRAEQLPAFRLAPHSEAVYPVK